MALRTDIKKAVQNNTNLKVNRVKFVERPEKTPNGKYEIYTVKIYVKAE